jgi:hypothetical protein
MSKFFQYGMILMALLFIMYIFHSCNPWFANKHDFYKIMTQGGSKFMIDEELYNPNITNLHKLNYPIIMKPNVCSGSGRQVSKIQNGIQALEYIKNFDSSSGDNIIIQEFDPAPYEVGILYQRYPWEKHGKIISLANKSSSENSDGKFIPRSCYNVICSDKGEWLTPQNTKVIIREIERIPEINACRIDILFNDLDNFKMGKDFRIIEINGRLGMNLSTDSHPSNIWRLIYYLYWLIKRFIMGAYNVLQLNGINLAEFLTHLPGKTIMSVKEQYLGHLFSEIYSEKSFLRNP